MLTRTAYKMKPPVSARLISGHPLADKLIACYLFNEGSGLTAFDSSGRGHHGTLTGAATWTVGKYGPAIELDGTTGHIVIPDHGDFSPTLTPFSIAVRVNMQKVRNFAIAGKGILGVDGEWYFTIDGSDEIRLLIYDEVANKFIAMNASESVETYQDKWVTLVGTFDGGILASGLTINLNCSRISDTPTTSGAYAQTYNLTGDIWIGKRAAGAFGEGLFDYTMFWRRVLTQSDIARLCVAPFCMFERRRMNLGSVLT